MLKYMIFLGYVNKNILKSFFLFLPEMKKPHFSSEFTRGEKRYLNAYCVYT